jgi:hypothetical protein
MATTLQISGPTSVSVALTGGTSILGYSDNDTLPSLQFNDMMHEVKTVLSGNAPEEIVTQGQTARISLALVKWDEAILNNLLIQARSTAAGNSSVGGRIVADTRYFGTLITATIGGSGYEFTHCYLQPDGVGDSQWGNRERVLTLNIVAFPDPSSGILFTYTA